MRAILNLADVSTINVTQIIKMKEVIIIFIILLLILFGIIFVYSQASDNIISPEVSGLADNETLRVVIDIKEPEKEEGFIFKKLKSDEEILQEKQDIKDTIINQVGEEDIRHIFDNQVAAEITKSDLENLKQNPNIEAVRIDKPIVAFLTDSVPLINATVTWPLQFNGTNLTGIGETICIIDTGVNFSHPDLRNKNLTCNIDCVGKDCVENCLVNDDNGHGTHVAGIAGANGTIKGVAIGSKIIGMKVLDSTGSGSGSDLEAGINWCINNANTYNISVISMSLGTPCRYSNGTLTGWCYSSYCDNVPVESSTAIIIDNAVSKNISVIIATGNDANTTQISSPACVKNATAVGATDKNDNIATSYSNRNNITDLMAPGSSIYSTMIPNPGGTILSACGSGTSYCALSGTSMATPHVAGAFAIVREFFRLQNTRVPTPQEIQNALNLTGKGIYDSSTGLNFSRIDIHSAILYLDTTAPNVTLSTPINDNANTLINQTFICNSSDFQLLNITFYLWNWTNSLIFNESRDITGTFNSSVFNVTNLNFEDYRWNCKTFDRNNYSAFASSNFTLSIRPIVVNLISPISGFVTNQDQSFNCNFSSQNVLSLQNSSFYIWNSSNSLIYNSSQNITGIINSSTFYYNFSNEGNYIWNCRAYDNNSNLGSGETNYSIKYDITFPNVTLLSSSVTTTTASINWTTNENSNHSLFYGTNANLTSNNSNADYSLIHNVSLTGLSSSTLYYYNITNCDIAGNCITNGTFNFTTSTQVIETSGSTGGSGSGGGGGSSKDYYPKDNEISSGYTQQITKENKIIFNITEKTLDGKSIIKTHTLSIGEIKNNRVTIIIKSNIINFTLGLGESKKINISSPDYYELYVRFDEITGNKAKITIKTINEKIIKNNIEEKPKVKPNETAAKNDRIIEIKDNSQITRDIRIILLTILAAIVIIVICFIIAIIIHKINNSSAKQKEKAIKEYKDVFDSHINIKSKNKRNKKYSY